MRKRKFDFSKYNLIMLCIIGILLVSTFIFMVLVDNNQDKAMLKINFVIYGLLFILTVIPLLFKKQNLRYPKVIQIINVVIGMAGLLISNILKISRDFIMFRPLMWTITAILIAFDAILLIYLLSKSRMAHKIQNKLRINEFNFIIMLSVLLIIINSIFSLIFPNGNDDTSRQIFNIAQCVAMLVIILLPPFLASKANFEIPKMIQIIYVVFGFSACILGDVANLYDTIPFWDSILHGFSGVLLGILGFILINTLNHRDSGYLKFSPIFVCIMTICFAVTIGTIWEICEYTMDHFFGTNSQQFMATTTGTLVNKEDLPLVGHEALFDTMKDLILDFVGAVFISVIGYIQLKRNNKGIARMGLRVIDNGKGIIDNNNL